MEQARDIHAANLLGVILFVAGPDADITVPGRHQTGIFIQKMQIKPVLCVDVRLVHSEMLLPSSAA
ncbi:hypothetical protein D3C85_1645800 [compost metagenome]